MVFGSITRGGKTYEIVKTVGDTHSNLQGRVTAKESYPDMVVEDTFTVKEKYESKESGGLCYDWYLITDHNRIIDRFTPQREDLESKLDYIAMMADIELEDENGIEELSEG